LPVLAADVGSLKDEVIEGETGFVFKSEDAADLSQSISKYFASDLFRNLEQRRQGIKEQAAKQHSWNVVGEKTVEAYAELLRLLRDRELSHSDSSKAALRMNTPQ